MKVNLQQILPMKMIERKYKLKDTSKKNTHTQTYTTECSNHELESFLTWSFVILSTILDGSVQNNQFQIMLFTHTHTHQHTFKKKLLKDNINIKEKKIAM